MMCIVFMFFWLFMLFFQCRSKDKYDGYLDIKNYTFCSNLIFTFPKGLIYFLFFNGRLVQLPLTIVTGQIINYVMFLSYLLLIIKDMTYAYVPLLKIYGVILIILVIIICVDFEVFCRRYKD